MTKADELHQEIEQLHAESMARLNQMAWQCEDLLTLCKELSQEITRHQQTPADLRAKRARTVLLGAADDTSRKMALRLILPWYTEELQTALQRMTQLQEQPQEQPPCKP